MKKLILAFFVFSSPIAAESFKIMGTRALGMGGAHVAVGGDAFAQYWNPAALGLSRNVNFQIPVGVQGELAGDILGSADRIQDLIDEFDKISEAQETGSYIGIEEINALAKMLKEIDDLNDPDKGALVDVSAGANFRISHLAFSVNNFTSAGIDPVVDIYNLGLGSATTLGGASVKKTQTDFEGINLGELIDEAVNIYGADINQLTGSVNDPTLTDESATLANGIITDIVNKVDVDLGGYTVDQVANAIINVALDPTLIGGLPDEALTTEEITQYVTQIEEIRPVVNAILDNAESGTTLEENESALNLRGVSIFEAALGYGRELPEIHLPNLLLFLNPVVNDLYAGGNIKYMKGIISNYSLQVFEETEEGNDPMDEFIDNFDEYYEESNTLGLDLGLLWDKKLIGKRFRYGLLMRNINSPKFDQPSVFGSSKYKVAPQIRGGVAFWPFNWWLFACDFDLKENSTSLPGYKSRFFSFGTEINIINRSWLNLALRGGIMKNIAESSAAKSYTAGIGLNLLHFVIDAGVAMSTSETEIEDGTEIPASVAGSVTISFNF